MQVSERVGFVFFVFNVVKLASNTQNDHIKISTLIVRELQLNRFLALSKHQHSCVLTFHFFFKSFATDAADSTWNVKPERG